MALAVSIVDQMATAASIAAMTVSITMSMMMMMVMFDVIVAQRVVVVSTVDSTTLRVATIAAFAVSIADLKASHELYLAAVAVRRAVVVVVAMTSDCQESDY